MRVSLLMAERNTRRVLVDATQSKFCEIAKARARQKNPGVKFLLLSLAGCFLIFLKQ
jgi:hypothetical protein